MSRQPTADSFLRTPTQHKDPARPPAAKRMQGSRQPTADSFLRTPTQHRDPARPPAAKRMQGSRQPTADSFLRTSTQHKDPARPPVDLSGVKPVLAVLLLAVGAAVGCRSASPPAPASPEPAVVVPAPAQPEPPPPVIGRVTGSSLNVRSGPATSHPVVAKLARGARVRIAGEDGDWLEVRLADERAGWVHGRYLAREAPCPPDRATAELLDGPPLSFSDGQSGMVVVEATVNAEGIVTAATVVSNTTAVEELAQRALDEVRQMRFAPPIRRCKPQPFLYEYHRSF